MQITANLESITRMIRKAEKASSRKAGSVNLVAVSKTQGQGALLEALAAGQRIFGENKVQEAAAHWSDLKKQYSDIRVHLIGPLQTNKAADAVALFDCIETLDREKLARALQEGMKKQGKNIPCMIQVNTGEEEQKAGIMPKDLPDFLIFCTQECGLSVTGLMCIPPADEPAALHFALLQKWGRALSLPDLSMGMSGDFLKAIPLGATHVRLGTALFGARTQDQNIL